MFTKKLLGVALLTALGLSVSAAQAASFDHRDRGFHQTARHGEFRHGHNVRHGHFSRHHKVSTIVTTTASTIAVTTAATVNLTR